ncbi:alpha/beta hydrolase [Aquihabitans sp. G128]|uniref:alpha/beta fold hydrolase n=1 Tax=Aquihabitans sp. G128 TaxID=2849779 RepID=UPI001C233FAE|nr:alpha/beta fold hydrolase [Aquihabitans sp. G128]QXC63257.1 alpha/beta hydrolase [Aquihabitans sp. G128]
MAAGPGDGGTDDVRWVEVLGVRVRYVDLHAEAAGLPLLVIPGHTARIEGFAELAPRLAAEHRVLVLDLPGSGESEKPVRRYDLRWYEDVLVAFLDALGIDRAIPVGGSLGGNPVLRLGHRFPERFPRLVLWAPGSAWTARPRLAKAIRATMGRWSFWPSVRIQSRYWYAPAFPGRARGLADTFAYYRRVMGPGFVAMYWGLAADQVGHSLFAIAGEVEQRTLLLWGDQDHGGGMGRGVARLHELLPDHRFHVFPGARHSLEAEIPEALAAEVLAFLREPPGPPT